MATQVFLHIGLPKTGTTYLQSVLWGAKGALAKDGYLLPGKGHREHLWAALELQVAQARKASCSTTRATATWTVRRGVTRRAWGREARG